MIAEPAPAQFRNITLTQIPVKMFPIFSHVTLTSL